MLVSCIFFPSISIWLIFWRYPRIMRKLGFFKRIMKTLGAFVQKNGIYFEFVFILIGIGPLESFIPLEGSKVAWPRSEITLQRI